MKKTILFLFVIIYSISYSYANEKDSLVYCISDTIINKSHIVINRYPQSIGISINKNNKEIKKIISYDQYDDSCEPNNKTNDIWINGTKPTSLINTNDSTYFFSVTYPNCVCCYSELKSFYITKDNQLIEFKNEIGIYRYFLIINPKTKKYLITKNVNLDGHQQYEIYSAQLEIKKTTGQKTIINKKTNTNLFNLLVEDPMSSELIKKLYTTYLK